MIFNTYRAGQRGGITDADGGSKPIYFKDTRCSRDVEEDLRAELATLRSDLAALADRVQRLELDRIAEKTEG